MNTPETRVRIKDSNGVIFEGSAYQCACRMLPNALMSSYNFGMGDMILSDFCRQFQMELVKTPFQKSYIKCL